MKTIDWRKVPVSILVQLLDIAAKEIARRKRRKKQNNFDAQSNGDILGALPLNSSTELSQDIATLN